MTQEKKSMDENITSHEYDGIRELNNPPPYWITLIFIVTIGFSMFYVIHFFGYPNNGKDQTSLYEKKVAEFEAKKAALQGDEGDTEMALADIIAEGNQLFLEKGCIACHGMAGEGNNIGPNLADNYWIHGCTPDEVIKVIAEGVPAKGMTPYKNVMTAKQISHLATYILESVVGSSPANPKDPQGEECKGS